MRLTSVLVAGLLATAINTHAAEAAPVTIDFESFSTGDIVGTIGNVTFSAAGGAQVYDLGGPFASSGTKTVGPSGSAFNGDLFLQFASPVTDVSFFSGAGDRNGKQANINIFTNGVLTSTTDLTGDGDPTTPDFQDLTAFSSVTRVEIVNVTDSAGLVYDDFSYDVAQSASVPVPETFGLLGAGLIGLVAIARRRR